MANLVNFVLFQLGWLACVLGGAWQLPWLGSAAVALIVGWHLLGVRRPRAELLLILAAGVSGALWDSALVAAGLLAYPSGTLIAGTAPHWIVAMWMLFATTLNRSLSWLQGRTWLAMAAGAVGGPLAFYAGQKLGGVIIPEPGVALPVLAVGWALLMPYLFWLAQRFDGVRESYAPARSMAGS